VNRADSTLSPSTTWLHVDTAGWMRRPEIVLKFVAPFAPPAPGCAKAGGARSIDARIHQHRRPRVLAVWRGSDSSRGRIHPSLARNLVRTHPSFATLTLDIEFRRVHGQVVLSMVKPPCATHTNKAKSASTAHVPLPRSAAALSRARRMSSAEAIQRRGRVPTLSEPPFPTSVCGCEALRAPQATPTHLCAVTSTAAGQGRAMHQRFY
jgi:hypothetical protein